MATLGDSPTLFNGQSWSQWLENAPKELLEEPEIQETSSAESPKKDSMKLRKEDIELYGICPARDEFYLVVCEHCNHVIKPQALQRHLDQRHSISPSYSSSNSDSSTCTSSTSQSPVKEQKVSNTGNTLSSNVHSKDHKHASNAHKPTKRPNNNGPPQVHPKEKPPEVSKCKKNPMVKMERIQSSGVNKTSGSSSCSNLSTDKGKKASGDRKCLTSEHTGINNSSSTHDSHVTPTTRAVTVLSSGALVTTAAPVISVAKAAALSSTKVTSTVATSASNCSKSSSSNYSSVTTTGSSGSSTKKLQLTTVMVTTTTVTASKPSKPALATHCSSGGSKKTSTRKTPLCKDREYDANKHCGVWMEEMKRQCTRSLTCKTHSLSLRRAVKGRSKSFDELLREHREAKEQLLLKSKGEASIHSSSVNNTATNLKSAASSSLTSPSSTPKSVPTTPTTPNVFKSPLSETKPSTSAVTSPVIVKPQTIVKEKLCLNSSITRLSSLPVFSKNDCVPVPESVSYLSSDGEEEEERDKIDYPCISHHPRPAAVNSFGSWVHGNGCYVFSRKEDLCRAALFAAVEKHLHPPPHKKLCIESNLPKGSTISTNTKDPYDFSLGDSVQGAGGGRSGSKGTAKTKSPTGSSSPISNIKSGLSEVTSPTKDMDNSDSNCFQSPLGIKRKRSSSVVQGINLNNLNNGSGVLSSPTTSLTLPVLCSSPIAITIPGSINFNLSSSTLSSISTSLATNKTPLLHGKNTLVKDVGKVCVDGNSQINGQLISLSRTNLAEVTHIQLNNLSEKCAAAKSSKTVGNKMQQSSPAPLLGQVSLNKSPVALNVNSKPSVFTKQPALPKNLAPLLSSVSVGGFLQLDAQLCNSVGSSALTLTTSTCAGGTVTNNNSEGLLSTEASPAQLSSPILLSGSASPTSPLNGLLSVTNTAKTTNNSNHGNHLCDTDSLAPKADLALTEELLTQHGAAFSLSPAKSDSVLSRSLSAGTEINAAVTQVSLSAAAATAQQLAAAALNLTTQSGCLLTASNNIPQLYATHHVLAKSSPSAGLNSIQLQTKPNLKAISGSPGKIPLQPLSLTILSPGSSGASNQHHHSHLVLHTADESHPAANLS